MTVNEYLAAPWWKRFGYRIVRNRLILFLITPVLVFVVFQRLDFGQGGRRERMSVHYTNLALAALALAGGLVVGWRQLLLIISARVSPTIGWRNATQRTLTCSK